MLRKIKEKLIQMQIKRSLKKMHKKLNERKIGHANKK